MHTAGPSAVTCVRGSDAGRGTRAWLCPLEADGVRTTAPPKPATAAGRPLPGRRRAPRGRAGTGEQRPPPPRPGHRAPSAAGDPAQGHPAGRRAGARARGGRDMRGPGPPRTWPPRRTPRDLPAQGGRDGAGPVTFRKDARSWCERARDTGRLVSRPKREAPVGYGAGNGGRWRRRGTLRARRGRGRRRGSHGPETPRGSGDPNAACTSRGGRFGICDLRPRVQGLVYSMPTHV